jgi:eukaryotic-like serine/threonine-protein kinase
VTAAATPSGNPLAPGYKLDRYELLCPIAEGGMAQVWVARQRGKHGFEKLVAIKTILPKFAQDARFQGMFLDEARIAARIEHVNVAQIFDLGEEHDTLYLAMEYVDGEALSKLNRACQRKNMKVPTGVLLRVLADTCSGLHEAHELRDGGKLLEIVHRDVSPHNILVSSKGTAKLIDFGIAKARSRVGNDTNSGVLKGKIQYMAPEQALGRPVDRRADVWAIGAILYHLLSGRPAYEGDNQLATLHLLGSGRPPVPLPDSVHPAIRGIVHKALSHSPDGRYETAAELRDAIEDAMIEAMVPTTTGDVAAFAAEHLAERTEKRKQSIELALAAAAERRRVEELLRPPGDRPSSSMITPATPASDPRVPGSVPRIVAAASTGSLPGDPTLPEVPAAKAPLDAIARLTARVSDVPPTSRSYATLGSAALDASEPVLPPPKSRRGLVMVIAVVLVAGAGATGVAFTMSRSSPKAAAAGAPPATTSALTVTSPTPPPPASSVATSAASAPSAAAATSSGIPTVSAGALPMATTAVRPPVRWTPPAATQPPPPSTATPPPPPKKKTSVDDGF